MVEKRVVKIAERAGRWQLRKSKLELNGCQTLEALQVIECTTRSVRKFHPFRIPTLEKHISKMGIKAEFVVVLNRFLEKVGDLVPRVLGVVDGDFRGLLSTFANALSGILCSAVG